MNLTDALLGRLTRKFDRTAGPVLALRLSYLGPMTWAVADDVLTTVVSTGVGENLSVDLTQYTIGTLASFLAAQPGYVVLYLDLEHAGLGAVALAAGAGDINTSNGDHIFVATNPNWALFNVYASELTLARQAIQAAPSEMATTTADGVWLDLLGSYYAVPRDLGEFDQVYGPRIAAEVLLPRQNNTAIDLALQQATGQLANTTDALVFGNPLPVFDGAIAFSGAPHFFNASAARIFNLFDVDIGYALTGRQTPADYLAMVRRQIDRLRAAGTHLRRLTLAPSIMADAVARASDALAEVWAQTSLFISAASVVSLDFGLGLFDSLLLAGAISRDNALATLTATAALSANFLAAGGFVPTARAKLAAFSTLPATSALQAAGLTTTQARATFSAAGGLAVTPGVLLGAATFAATANVTAAAIASKAGVAVFAMSAGLTASATSIGTQQASATLAGQTALAASVSGTSLASATFAGSSGFAADTGTKVPASALFFGIGTATAAAIRATSGFGVFVPTGGFVASAIITHPQQGAATFSATAAWSPAPFTAEFTAEFGEGINASITAAVKSGAASFAAIGAWSDPFSQEFTSEFGDGLQATRLAAGPGAQLATAALLATGGWQSTARVVARASATFAATGGVVADLGTRIPASAQLSGVGVATAAARRALPGVAIFVPVSGLAASAIITHPQAGAATFSASASWGSAPFTAEFTGEFGEGINTSITAATKSGAATFSALGAWSDPFSKEFTPEFGDGLQATRVPVGPGQVLAAATFPASTAWQATARVAMRASAAFAGAGGVTADNTQRLPAGATLAAAGVLASVASRAQPGVAIFVPAGGLAAAATVPSHGVSVAAAATVAGSAVLTGLTPWAADFANVFGSEGIKAAVVLAGSQQQAAAASFSGAGTTSIDAGIAKSAVAVFVPSGQFTARAVGVSTWQGAAGLAGQTALQAAPSAIALVSMTFAGTGGLAADSGQKLPATSLFFGTGGLSAAAGRRQSAVAVFVPVGNLTAAAITTHPVFASATFAASASWGSAPFTSEFTTEFGEGIAATVSQKTQSGAAAFIGFGAWSDPFTSVFTPEFGEGLQATLVPAGPGPKAGSATFSAASSLGASARLRLPSSAVVAGTGSLFADTTQRLPATALFFGTGGVNANGRRALPGVAVFVPAGGFTATASGIATQQASAALPGQGALQAAPVAVYNVSAALTGDSGLAANLGQIFPASSLFFGTGGLTGNGIRSASGIAVFAPTGGFTASASVSHPVFATASFAGYTRLSGASPFAASFSTVFGNQGPRATKIP